MFFSDDGLALTGGTIQRKSEENSLKDAVHYKIQDKQAFLSHLNRIFAGNMFTNVKFSDIEVMRHPMRKDIYLVTLHQDWASSNYKGIGYHDTGFLQLFWQFSDQGKDPLILFRSWHPDELINGDKGQLFSFEDINIIPIN